ncbi:MAG: nuclear transport factor 2 family protein [Paracoccaceae bacterium]
MTPIDTVKIFYDAIARGDIPSFIAILHPQLEWTEAEGFPYYGGTWRTPQAVLENLLIPIGRDWDGFSVLPHDFIADGNRVVTLGIYSGTAKATGKSMRAPFAHVWGVREAKLARFDMYTDTALVNAALYQTKA